MKKKILICFLSLICAFAMAFSSAACNLFDSGDNSAGNENSSTDDTNNGGSGNTGSGSGSTGSGSGNTGSGSGNTGSGSGNTGSGTTTPHKHSYEWVIQPKPTKTIIGEANGSCKYCDDTKKVYLPALTDSKYSKTKDSATCSKKGAVGYTIVISGEMFSFTVETPATGDHTYKDGVCTGCGTKNPTYVPHNHSYKNLSDSDGHWTECSCGDKTAKTPHSYSYASDGDGHWQVCSVGKETTVKVAHIYTDGVCVCGVKEPAAGHKHTYEDKHDATGHWTECACGDKTAKVPHSYKDGVCSCGATKPANELEYQLNENGTEYTVIGIGTVTSKHVVIPATYNGLPVTEIGHGAFEGCDMTEITVPASIRKISFSFYKCDNLAKVNYTGTVAGWASIETWISPSGHILYNSHSLYIGGKHITEVAVDNIDYFGGAFMLSDIVSVKIGSGVKTLCSYAFSDCTSLVSVEIADGVKIGEEGVINSTFRNCAKLSAVKLPSDLKIISQSMFEGCQALKQINLPKGLTHIDDYAFGYSGLTSVVIPASVVRVGAFAFIGCANLKSISFEDSNYENWQISPHLQLHGDSGLDPDANPKRLPVHISHQFDMSDAKSMLVILTNPAQAYTNNLIYIDIMPPFSDDDGPQYGEIEMCKITVDGGAMFVNIEGVEYYLEVSYSFCKGDIYDTNACGWSSMGMGNSKYFIDLN